MATTLKQQIISYFSDRDDISAVYLFGSIVSDRLSINSDIDIAVLTHSGDLSFPDQMDISQELSDITGREIDLVELSEVSVILRNQVLRKGELIICQDKRALNHFIVRTNQEYIDLKRVRKPIEESLGNVSIYG
ncbi:MAG: nucleotidyltransferase domain-containing protein [Candidatus Marinimicrobia bacterium]|nr:nucleotidyltransferase domain-containing protein [Candidatus Neomarinimicrobiota bacterium]